MEMVFVFSLLCVFEIGIAIRGYLKTKQLMEIYETEIEKFKQVTVGYERLKRDFEAHQAKVRKQMDKY